MNSRIVAADHSRRRIAQFEDHPAMPALLKELTPRAVGSLFQEVGVVDAAVLMAMMPTRALLLAFDDSIWKSPRPGLPETISVHELVDWLVAWSDIGEPFLIQQLEAMNEDYLTALLSRIVKVESHSRYAVYSEDPESFVKLCDDDRERIGPYIVVPIVDEDEDVVLNVVRALWSSDAQRILRLFGRLSDLENPVDSTRGSTATLHDVESERESFREAQGFVTADGARAFFEFAERLTATDIAALDKYDAETRRYLDAIARASESPNAAPDRVVAPGLEDDQSTSTNTSMVLNEKAANMSSLRLLLEEAQLLPRHNSVALLKNARRSKELTLTVELRRLANDNMESFHARGRELAYLANVLRWTPNAIGPLNDNDVKEAAFAICNLGIELATSTHADELDKEPGLIRSFMRGWNALTSTRSRVIGAFAGALSQNSMLAPWLQSEATAGLADLRRAIEERRFEAAREATILLSIVFDSRVCRAVAPLLDAIPRFSTLLEGDEHSQQARWIASKADLHIVERRLDSLRSKSTNRPRPAARENAR